MAKSIKSDPGALRKPIQLIPNCSDVTTIIDKAGVPWSANPLLVAVAAAVAAAVVGAVLGTVLGALLNKCCAVQQECKHCKGEDQNTDRDLDGIEMGVASSGGPREEPRSQTPEAVGVTAVAGPRPIVVPSTSYRKPLTTTKHRRSRSGPLAGGTETIAVPLSVPREAAIANSLTTEEAIARSLTTGRLDEIKELHSESSTSPRLKRALLEGANERS